MEQILNKLSEIEATANAIMQDAARQKQLTAKTFVMGFVIGIQPG